MTNNRKILTLVKENGSKIEITASKKKKMMEMIARSPSLEKELNRIYIDGKFKYVTSIRQYIFNYFSDIEELDRGGKCVVCGQMTPFNLLTNKYSRFDKPSCVNKYKEEFKERMNRVHGRSYFTQDPEAQKKMLNGRDISKKVSYGGYEFTVVGTYEEDFLEVMFKIFKCNPADLIECPFTIDYELKGTKRFYMPDFYMPSLNLVIEVKSSKSAYADRDYEFEMVKKRAGEEYMMKKNGYYFYLIDKNYSEFAKYLEMIVDRDKKIDMIH